MTITTQKENPNALLITKFQAEVEKSRRNEIIENWQRRNNKRERTEWCKNERERWYFTREFDDGWKIKDAIVYGVIDKGEKNDWEDKVFSKTFDKFYDLFLEWRWKNKNKPVENDFSKSRLITEKECEDNATFKRICDKNGFRYSPISQRAVTLMETLGALKIWNAHWYIYIKETEILHLNSRGHKDKILIVDQNYMIIPNPFDKKEFKKSS